MHINQNEWVTAVIQAVKRMNGISSPTQIRKILKFPNCNNKLNTRRTFMQ